MRTGLIARKLGMSRVFTPEGEHVPVTVLKLDACRVRRRTSYGQPCPHPDTKLRTTL